MNGKQLKNSILQWAIQGKLVPQNPKDEPASKLLERIAAARNGDDTAPSVLNESSQCHPERSAKGTKSKDLAKKKKSKTETSRIYREGSSWFEESKDTQGLPAGRRDITEEIPFEIPESWEWCRLESLGDFTRGSGIKRDETVPVGKPCVRYGEMYTTYKTAFSVTKSFTRQDIFDKCHKIKQNDILMALTGENKWDIALAAVYQGEDEVALGGDLCKFSPVEVFPLFLVYLINSPYGIEYKTLTSTGDIIVHTSVGKLGNFKVPLPPLAEQKRIVKKLEQILPLVDEYDQAQTQLDKLNKELPETLKKSILQQAIQGKLVPQNPKDEPADKLLERITISRHSEHSEESSKKSRKFSSKNPVSRIYRDTDGLWYEQIGSSEPIDISEEIPFEIPETWAWIRLNYVCDIARGGSPRPIQDYLTDSSDGYNWIKIGDTEKGGKYINSTKEKIKPEGLKKSRLIHKGDFLLTNSMSFGRPYISNIEGCIHDGWLVISMQGESFDSDYLYYLLSSQYAYNQFCGKVAGAVVKNLNSDKVAESLIPLPPLAEQKRIVAKLEQLFKAL